jgi:hypothetical protein
MSREAMQMALGMLNEIADDVYCDQKLEGVITALRQALDTDLARVGEVGVWGAVQCEPQEALEDGWCDWVCPKPVGYLMQCCDCELIHEVDFRVVRYESEDSEVYEVVDNPNLQAQMRLRRRDDISPKKPHQEKQEPVAWLSEGGDVSRSKRYMDEMGFKCNPLYTAPKQWVGLTDEELKPLCDENHIMFGAYTVDFIQAIEAKLKEKNT